MNASVKAETPLQHIVESIERAARKRFPDALVDRVRVEDSDDGDVLKIYVVLNDPEAINPKKVAGFIEQIRKTLEDEFDEDRFPLVSYFSKVEAAELFPETC